MMESARLPDLWGFPELCFKALQVQQQAQGCYMNWLERGECGVVQLVVWQKAAEKKLLRAGSAASAEVSNTSCLIG